MEQHKRAGRALTSVVATCYLLGISTRRMDRMVEWASSPNRPPETDATLSLAYTFGMVFPLFAMVLGWDRYRLGE